MILFRPVGVIELKPIAESGFRHFSPRLEGQPIFYPVLTLDYARRIARDWNTNDPASGFAGYVTKIDVNNEYVKQFDIQTVGGRQCQELWIPAERLDEFNNQIIGVIEVVESYYGDQFVGEKRDQDVR